jgi:hypothetical protein
MYENFTIKKEVNLPVIHLFSTNLKLIYEKNPVQDPFILVKLKGHPIIEQYFTNS